MADLANIAAATAAGYKEVVGTRGGITYVTLEKTLSGPSGGDVFMLRAHGEGANQGAAETAALASLNAQRADRYARDSAIPKSPTQVAAVYPAVGTVKLDSFENYVGVPAAGGQPLTTDLS
jgi:hypothetical protein